MPPARELRLFFVGLALLMSPQRLFTMGKLLLLQILGHKSYGHKAKVFFFRRRQEHVLKTVYSDSLVMTE